MTEHEFRLVLGRPPDGDGEIDALFEAGCGDGTFAGPAGVPVAEFARDADSMAEAVLGAISAVESVMGAGAVTVVEPDLVSLSDIAELVGRTRQSVQQLAAGQRGPGMFPPATAHLMGRTRLYKWWEIAQWFGMADETVQAAREIAQVNAALVIRAMRQSGTPLRSLYRSLLVA